MYNIPQSIKTVTWQIGTLLVIHLLTDITIYTALLVDFDASGTTIVLLFFLGVSLDSYFSNG